jgi:hypothetical protein
MAKVLISIGILLVVIRSASGPRVHAQETAKLSLQERVLVASKIYRTVSAFLPWGWSPSF